MAHLPFATDDGTPPPWIGRVPRIAGFVVLAVGVAVLVGWITDTVVLKTFGGPNSAPIFSAFVVIMTGLSLIVTDEPNGPRPPLGSALVGAIAVLGVLMVLQALTDWIPNDENVWFPTLPNAVLILLFAVSQLGPRKPWASRSRAIALTLFVILGIGFSLVAVYRAHELSTIDGGARPSVPGALAFFAAMVGLTAARSNHRPISWMWPNTLTGAFSRRLFPTAVFVPMALGALSYLGYAADWYSMPFALTLLTVTVTTATVAVVSITAGVISRAENRINRATARFQALMNAAPYATLLVDRAGVIRFANPPVEVVLGYAPADLVGQPIEVLIPVLQRAGHAQLREGFVAPTDGGDGGHPADLHALHRIGHHVPIEISLSQVTFAEGPNTVVALRDVSEKRAAEVALREANERLRVLAEHDELTGLPNRRRLEADLEQHFDSYPLRTGGLLFIDLDHFKEVNDTLGHRAGDALLAEVAHAMSARISGTTLLARQGGDEFLVLVRHGGVEEARSVAKEMQGAVREASSAFDGGDFEVTASIGIVALDQVPRSDTPSTTALICADIALYAAKNAGGDQIAVFDDMSH